MELSRAVEWAAARKLGVLITLRADGRPQSSDVVYDWDGTSFAVSVIADVDLTGDERESNVAVRLRALEAKIDASPAVAGTLLSLSAPDEPSLTG